MELVVHPGMHKTGSSSIQDTLSARDVPDYHYAAYRTSNHSPLFALLFEQPIDNFHAFRRQGLTATELEPEKSKWMEVLKTQLEASERPRFIISAERMSVASEDALNRMVDFFADYVSHLSVLAYVRPPYGIMTSSFQQMLKGPAASTLDFSRLWPSYRARFEKFDRVFGRENVSLRLFDRAELVGGDAVLDFCHTLGIPIAPEEVRYSNEGLTLEAASLIFAQRKIGGGAISCTQDAGRRNGDLIKALSGLGDQKFELSQEACAPVVEKNLDDLHWMQERLGRSLDDASRCAAQKPRIASEQDLLATAVRFLPLLCDLLEVTRQRNENTWLVRDLEVLRDAIMSYRSAVPGVSCSTPITR